MIFLTRKIGQKIPNCHHVQLDQNAILDKSIWTQLFQHVFFWPTAFWPIWQVILTSYQSDHWSKWPSLQMVRYSPLVILTFHLWLQHGIIWCHLLSTLSSTCHQYVAFQIATCQYIFTSYMTCVILLMHLIMPLVFLLMHLIVPHVIIFIVQLGQWPCTSLQSNGWFDKFLFNTLVTYLTTLGCFFGGVKLFGQLLVHMFCWISNQF